MDIAILTVIYFSFLVTRKLLFKDVFITCCCFVDLLKTASMLLNQLEYTGILHHQYPAISDKWISYNTSNFEFSCGV